MSFNKTGVINYSGSPNDNLFLYTPRTKAQTSYLAYTLNLSENLVADQSYTIQLWDVDVANSQKTSAQLGIWIYWGGGSVSLTNWKDTDFTNGHADYLKKTITPTSTQASKPTASNAWLCFYNSTPDVSGATRNMSIGKWKIEKGSIPTNWVPCKQDEMNVGNSSFIEENDIAKIQSNGYIQALEFIEI